jgi:hypothetical protein
MKITTGRVQNGKIWCELTQNKEIKF